MFARKKTIYIILVFFSFFYCVSKRDKVERIIEDGVEVVINHIEPYQINDEPCKLILEEEFTIDLESEDLAKIGMGEFAAFDVDSEGNIYFWSQDGSEALIFKFNKKGEFVASFGRKGQGPGELQLPIYLKVGSEDEIAVTDSRKGKLIIYDQNGKLIKEASLDFRPIFIIPLHDGKYLVRSREIGIETEYFPYPTSLYSAKFEKIKELQRGKFPNFGQAKRIEGIERGGIIGVTKNNIYLTSSAEGYEICVYDMQGNLIRKVRKEYKKVLLTKEDEKKILKRFESYPEEVRKKVYIPKFMPPFQYGFVDDVGRLFVMTYERGRKPREYKYDVFNAKGVFTGRISLDNYGQYGRGETVLFAMAKNERIYCIQQKESGFKNLVVYIMKWNYQKE